MNKISLTRAIPNLNQRHKIPGAESVVHSVTSRPRQSKEAPTGVQAVKTGAQVDMKLRKERCKGNSADQTVSHCARNQITQNTIGEDPKKALNGQKTV
jgi:hypothetical protein